jgi:hypothetical protein
MSYVTWKFERYPFVSAESGWSSTAVTLTNVYDPQVTVNLGDARDTFSFKVTNFNDEWSNYFQPNDKITIYRVVNSSTVASSDVLMVGSIQNTPENESGKQTQIRVEGANFSENILSAIVFFDPTGQTIPSAMQAALLSLSNYNQNFGVTWNTGNPSVTSTGASFPTVTERWFNKPIRAFVEKYSTADLTLDGNYYYYVDNNNKLVWGKKDDAADHAFNASTAIHKSLRITKDLKDVKNWIIVKGGVDPKGAAIQTRVQDMSSIAKNGLKPYILVTIAKNAETLLKADLTAQNVTAASDLTFPYTPPWNSGSSCANFDEYVEDMRVYVIAQAKKEGQAFIDGRKNGKLKVDLTFSPGDVSWALGDVVACTIPSLSSNVKNMRVTEIVYATDIDTYTLVEDIGSI